MRKKAIKKIFIVQIGPIRGLDMTSLLWILA